MCINILSNVRSNAELQSRGPREVADDDVPDAADAVCESVLREEVFRASYGTIRVMPLSWGDDVPACLSVPHSTTPSLLKQTPCSVPFFILFSVFRQPHPRQRLRVQRVASGTVSRHSHAPISAPRHRYRRQ